MTCTWTLVRSGTASIGRFKAECTPIPATSSVPISTRKRFRRAVSISALSMDGGPLRIDPWIWEDDHLGDGWNVVRIEPLGADGINGRH